MEIVKEFLVVLEGESAVILGAKNRYVDSGIYFLESDQIAILFDNKGGSKMIKLRGSLETFRADLEALEKKLKETLEAEKECQREVLELVENGKSTQKTRNKLEDLATLAKITMGKIEATNKQINETEEVIKVKELENLESEYIDLEKKCSSINEEIDQRTKLFIDELIFDIVDSFKLECQALKQKYRNKKICYEPIRLDTKHRYEIETAILELGIYCDETEEQEKQRVAEEIERRKAKHLKAQEMAENLRIKTEDEAAISKERALKENNWLEEKANYNDKFIVGKGKILRKYT